MQNNIEDNSVGVRLDRYYTDQLQYLLTDEALRALITRNYVQEYLMDMINVNGKTAKNSYKLRKGDIIEIDLEEIRNQLEDHRSQNSDRIISQKGELNIVDETENYLIINKPSGLSVHPGSGQTQDTLANYVKGYLEGRGVYDPLIKRAGIVHRLDKPVSGLIVFAKKLAFQNELMTQFQQHQVLKIYKAGLENNSNNFYEIKKVDLEGVIRSWVDNADIPNDWERVEGFIERDHIRRVRMKFSLERYNQSQRKALSYIIKTDIDEVLVLIRTGRMHQIRATLAYLQMPIKGDTLYGSGRGIPADIDLASVVLGFTDDKKCRVVYRS